MTKDWRLRIVASLPGEASLTEGDATAFGFALESITLMDGDSLPVQQSGVTAVVGANNSGKSTILREVSAHLAHYPGRPSNPHIAVKSLSLRTSGTTADLVAWLGESASFFAQPGAVGFQRSSAARVDIRMLPQYWRSPTAGLAELWPFLVFYGDAQGRFAIGAIAEMRHEFDGPPEHPIHYLQDSKERLEKLSAITTEVFNTPLTLDTLARTLRLRVGAMKQVAPQIDNIPLEYRKEMSGLPPVDEQGDGMRSLLGQLLPIVSAAYKLVILDEPEAFLHPPQAHALGVQLGRLASEQSLQVILATHDRSLLTGLLDSGADVSVVRLTRASGPSKVSHLNPEDLQSLWSDPVLKYSNVLDGLFHQLVVLAEAEGDCAFLAAALECSTARTGGLSNNEVLFIPTGGKDGMAKVAKALRAVGVPVVAAPDLDMLSNVGAIKALVESLGECWTDELQSLWKKATANLNAPKGSVKVSRVLEIINKTLNAEKDATYSADHQELVKTALRTTRSPWTDVKDHGVSAFRGDARTAVDDLVAQLDQLGVVLVKEGELERLAPEVAKPKGPGWLREAFEANAQGNSFTQHHIQRIVSSGAAMLNRDVSAKS